MKLSELTGAAHAPDPDIVGLASDSRAVKPGYLFAALSGFKDDGSRYIPQAEENGAVAILAADGEVKRAVFIRDAEPRRKLAQMAARFYPRQPETIAGVTGTNGKTSTARFSAQLWTMLGVGGASLGTLGALRQLKSRGLIRAFGVSTKSCEGAIRAIESTDVVMLTLNPRDREDVSAVQLAHERNVGVLVKKALLSGHIDLVEGGDSDSHRDPVEACLRFVFAHPGVSSVIVGTIDPDHLKHDVHAAERAFGN